MPPTPDSSVEGLDQLLEFDGHFTAALALAEPFFDGDQLEAVGQIANDIAIYAVEGHDRPKSVVQIRALCPSLRRAGLGWACRTIVASDVNMTNP